MSIVTYDHPIICPLIYPTTKPNFIERRFCNCSINFLGYHIWAYPVNFFCISTTESTQFSYKWVRYDTVKGLRRGAKSFTIPISPKYSCYWFCISSRRICSTTLKNSFGPLPLFTMNKRLPNPYLLAKLIKLSTMYLEIETEIYCLSVYLSISLFDWI